MTRRLIGGLLALVAVACGDGQGQGSEDDGANGGGGGDVSTGGSGGHIEAGVYVVDERGRPVAGIDIVLHDASGAVVSAHQTDAQGFVDVARHDGEMVSAVWMEAGRFDATRTVSTIVGADPTAPLRFVATPAGDKPPQMSITTTATGANDEVLMQGSCGNNSMLGVGTLGYVPCPRADSIDVTVYYWDEPLWQVLPSHPIGGDVAIVIDDSLAEPAPRVEVIAAELPEDVVSISGALWAYRPDGGYNSASRSVQSGQGAFPALWVLPVYVPPGSHVLHRGRLHIGDELHFHSTSSWHDAVQAQIVVHPVSLADIASATVGDADLPVSWSLDDGPRGDALRVDMTFPSADPSDPAERPRRWLVHLPPDATSATLPALPPALADWVPASGPTQVLVEHVDADGDDVAAAANARAEHRSEQSITRYAAMP